MEDDSWRKVGSGKRSSTVPNSNINSNTNSYPVRSTSSSPSFRGDSSGSIGSNNNGSFSRSSSSGSLSGSQSADNDPYRSTRPPNQKPPFYKGRGNSSSSARGHQQRPGRNSNSGRTARGPTIVPEFENESEREKFRGLVKEIPHLKMPHFVRDYVAYPKQKLDNFVVKMLSDEWIELQRSGWKFHMVIRTEEATDELMSSLKEDDQIMELDNKWGDLVVFTKV